MIKRYIETGEIVSTHGIKGEVRVNPWCDSPEFLIPFKNLYTDAEGNGKLKVTSCRPHKNIVIIKFDGIDTVEDAAKMRSTVLYIDRKDAKLKKGAYFVQDLLGCEVYDHENGILYGEIKDVFSNGANDVWTIKKEEKEYLFPAVKEFIKLTDTQNERIEILPPGGIFDEPDEV